MSVLKRNSVYFGGGVDISNTIEPHRKPAPVPQPAVDVQEAPPEAKIDPEQELLEAKRRLEQRMAELDERERGLARQKQELDEMKARYVEQGKEVILEAYPRAYSIIAADYAHECLIKADEETNRDSV